MSKMKGVSSQQGVALALLLWIIAALSILLAGVLYQVKVDTKMTQWQRTQVKAEALGDAVIQLQMARIVSEPSLLGGGYAEFDVEFDEHVAQVEFVPAAGLVDINRASREALVRLFVARAGLSEAQADQLADDIQQWRSSSNLEDDDSYSEQPGKFKRGGLFEAPEDLMLVSGISRELYDRIKSVISVAKTGVAEVNTAAAPPEVLAFIVDDQEQLADLLAQRQRDVQNTPLAGSAGTEFRVRAKMQIDGDYVVRTRWVRIGRAGPDGLPWLYYRVEPVSRARNKDSAVEESA